MFGGAETIFSSFEAVDGNGAARPGSRGDRHPVETSTGVERDAVIAAALSRAIDCVAAALLLVAMLPVLIILAIALQIDSPGKLFFVQWRVGKGGRMFPCIKFRTMCMDADAALARHLAQDPLAREEWERDHKLRDDPRITRLGGAMRKLSLDELPQLLNILVGHMALVGPRPIVPAEIEKYGAVFADYCSVRPGLTGLWQVSGRNDVSYEERVALDRDYVSRKSLAFDIEIMFRTVPAVLGQRGSC